MTVPLISPPKVTVDKVTAKIAALSNNDNFFTCVLLGRGFLLLGNNDTYHV